MGYVDGMSRYEFVGSGPSDSVDPLGLRMGTLTMSADPDNPRAPAAHLYPDGTMYGGTNSHVGPPIRAQGHGAWGVGLGGVEFEWSIIDTSAMADMHAAIGTAGPGIFKQIKVTKGACPCESLSWIQYTAVKQNGAVLLGPEGWPYDGIDTGKRDDDVPYVETPEDQDRINRGEGLGWHATVRPLYDPIGFDSTFIDWASASGNANYRHDSIVLLVCRRDGKDVVLGAMKFMYRTDAAGKLADFRAAVGDAGDVRVVEDWLRRDPRYPDYMRTTYGGLPR